MFAGVRRREEWCAVKWFTLVFCGSPPPSYVVESRRDAFAETCYRGPIFKINDNDDGDYDGGGVQGREELGRRRNFIIFLINYQVAKVSVDVEFLRVFTAQRRNSIFPDRKERSNFSASNSEKSFWRVHLNCFF